MTQNLIPNYCHFFFHRPWILIWPMKMFILRVAQQMMKKESTTFPRGWLCANYSSPSNYVPSQSTEWWAILAKLKSSCEKYAWSGQLCFLNFLFALFISNICLDTPIGTINLFKYLFIIYLFMWDNCYIILSTTGSANV